MLSNKPLFMIKRQNFKLPLILILLVGLALTACVNNTIGSGPITLSPKTLGGYEHFKGRSDVDYFAVTEDGADYAYSYCEGNNTSCIIRPVTALSYCFNLHKQKCKIFANRVGIVWQNSSGRPVTLAEVSGGYTSSTQSSLIKAHSNDTNSFICLYALHDKQIKWTNATAGTSYIKEAKNRNLTPQQCATIVGRSKTKTVSSSGASNASDAPSNRTQERLEELKSLIDKGLITEEDAAQKRTEILEGL